MHKTIEEVNKLFDIQEKLTEMLQGEVNEGKEYMVCHYHEIGELSDMVKDMAEAAKYTMKKKYYEMLVCELMKEDDEMEEVGRMGYDNYRHANGKFAKKGTGHYVGHGSHMRMGFTDMPWPNRVDPYNPLPFFPGEDGGIYDPHKDYRMGYPMPERIQHDMQEMRDHSGKGRHYDEYKMARKHYTSSHDEEDHRHMDDEIMEHTMEVSDTMGEMWRDASPETRKHMKTNLKQLLDAWERG